MAEITEFVFRTAGRGIFPTCPEGEAYLEEVGPAKDIMVKLWTPRNMKRHRRFWAMMGEAARNIDGPFVTSADLVNWCKIHLGMYKVMYVDVQQNKEVIQPTTTKVASMDEVAFKRFEKRLMDLLFEKFGFVPEDIQNEVNQMLAAYGTERKR